MNENVSPLWEIHINRKFKAPRALVFAAWTDPAHLAHWSGPEGLSARQDYFDCRPGGRYRACLSAPDGTEYWLRGEYLEVDAPARLVFTHAWEEEDGSTSPETTITITFAESDGETRMHFHQAPFTTQANRDGHYTGWSSSIDKLERYIEEQQAVAS